MANYNLKRIGDLLQHGFNESELRNFCFYEAKFRSVYDQSPPHLGKTELIRQLVEYAQQRGLEAELLAWAKEQNPAKYEQYQPYDETSGQDFSAIRQEYCDYLIKELKDHTIRGFAPQVGGRVISLPLAKIFLPLQAIEGRPALAEYAEEDLMRQTIHSEKLDELEWQRQYQELEKRQAQLSARQAAQRPLTLANLLKESRSVLLGDPGTGKTTVTRYVTYALAAGDVTHIGESVRGLVPVLVRLATYAKGFEQRQLHLIDYIEKELTPRPEFGQYLRQAIASGQCLIILDGLDEVTDPGLRIQIINRIQKMVAGFSHNRFMVTSRIIGYDVSPLTREFTHATLKELAPKEQERFVKLWYEAIKSEISESAHAEGANTLIEALRNKPQIARMAANPLLLTIMVLMHWRGVKLPNRRVQVYQIATDTLIEYWTAQRGAIDLDAEEVKAILAPVAHYILSSNVGGVIAHHDLFPRFCRGIGLQRGCDSAETKRLGRQLLRALGEQSGLFLERGLDANNQPVYGFLHQTFGEYLAALHLADEILSDAFVLEKYIHRSVWREPMLLLAGHLSLVSQTHVSNLLRDILDFPAGYEAMLQRNLLLAADCLADDVQIKPDLRWEILEKLAELLRHEAPQVQEAALHRYQRLAATRNREAALTALKQVYSLDQADQLAKISAETRLNLATALVYLNEPATAQPLLWPLEDQKYRTINQIRVRRLRFTGWPDQAADYLLRLQADNDYNFELRVGPDLAHSTLGPVDAETARRVLGEAGLAQVIEKLLDRIKDKTKQARLRWLAILTFETPSIEALLDLTTSETPAQIRCLAATRLLDSNQRSAAIGVLQELVENEPDQAHIAARALLETAEAAHLGWQLLRDIALLADHENASQAIAILLKAGDLAIAVPAALHLLATSRPHGFYEVRFRLVVESLVEHNYTKVGLAAARWLALRPGHDFRLQACEILLEAGQVKEAIPLLQFLAYECHDEASQRACQRLLMLKEAERVAPLLNLVSDSAEPHLRYQACLALALTNHPASNQSSEAQGRGQLKLAILAERTQAYQTALTDFCQAGLETLKTLEAVEGQAQSAQTLGRLSLNWLAESWEVNDWENQLTSFLNDPWPAISLNGALFDLRLGRFERAHSHFVALLRQAEASLSLPVRLKVLELLGKMVSPETTLLLLQALQDKEGRVRETAAKALGPLGDPAATDPLIAALSDEDNPVRSSAAESLGELGNPEAVQPLIAALNDESFEVRQAAVRALGELGDPAAVHHLILALSDEQSRVRWAAAQALGELDDQTAVQPLINTLNDKDRGVRLWAALSLERLGSPTAVQPLLSILGEEDKNARSAIVSALGRLGDVTIMPTLTTMLDAEDSNVRASAAELLGLIGDSTVIQPLLAALSDEISDVRASAARGLGRIDDPGVAQPLIAALNDKESEVREAAARALGWLEEATATQDLLTILADEDSKVRGAAAFALGELSDSSDVVQSLIATLSDADVSVCWATAQSLGKLGDPAAVQPLITMLNTNEGFIAEDAAGALGQLEDLAAIKYLIAAFTGQNERFRSLIAKALGRLGAAESTSLLAATSVVGDSFPAERYATALIHLDPAAALPVLDRYEGQFRKVSWTARLRGEAYWRLGNIEAALSNWHRAIEKEASSPNLLALAHFYLEQNELQTAGEYIEQALQVRPRYRIRHLSQAVVLWYSGETTEALEKLEQARRRYRRITNIKDLQYEHFWRERAITALEAMLAHQARDDAL